MQLQEIQTVIQFAGTLAFAVTAVLAVAPRGIDLFGACVMGVITAIGGGTIRDLILGVPVFWSTDLTYIWIALGGSVVTFAANSLFTRKEIYALMLYLDALGVALFAIQATDKAWAQGFGLPVAPVLLGIVTAIGGGLMRDVMAGNQNLLMKRELYAVPVLLGSTGYVLVLEWLPDQRQLGALICGMAIFALRAAAIHWDLRMPDWLATRPKTG